MRRALFFALFAAPAVFLVVAGCGDESFSEGDNPDGAPGDGSDAASDGRVSSNDGAPGIDSDAPACTGGWCRCAAKTAVFCDDFDRTNERPGDTWTYDGSFASTDGGTLQLTDAEAMSAPQSLAASLASDTTGNDFSAALTEDLGVHASTVAFDLLLPSLGNCSGASVDFAELGFDQSFTILPINSVSFGVSATGAPHLAVSGTATTDFYGDASLPTTWVRIRLTTRVYKDDAGTMDVAAAMYLTPGGTDDAVDASPLLSGSGLIHPDFTHTWVSLGVRSRNVATCRAYIDNVTVYQ